jgi:hypothetical protein
MGLKYYYNLMYRFFNKVLNYMNHKELLDAANKLTKNLEGILLNATFIKDDPNRMAGSLALTIFELHIGVLTLMGSYSQSHSPLLVRSMQETFVNLKCLSNDELFLNQIHHDDAHQNVKIFSEFLKALDANDSTREEIQQRLVKQQSTLETHKKNKVGKLFIGDKFKLAGLGQSYAAYSVMCSFTHNNATTVYARHGTGDTLDFANELPIETFKMILRISVLTFIDVLNLLPNFSNVSQEKLDEVLDSNSKEVELFTK